MGRLQGSRTGFLTLVEKTCEKCGNPFKVEPYRAETARFCSRRCLANRPEHRPTYLPRETRLCQNPNCGKTFIVIETSRQLCCSAECGHIVHNQKLRKPPRLRTCQQCGVQFDIKLKRQYETKIGSGKFCSRRCANESYKRRASFTCAVCNKTFIVRAKYAKIRKTCSRRCRTVYLGFAATAIETAMSTAMGAAGLKPHAQFPIGSMTVDFAFPEQKLVIECDGIYWHSLPEVQARDMKRDARLHMLGWSVVRLSEPDIHDDANSCVAKIKTALSAQ